MRDILFPLQPASPRQAGGIGGIGVVGIEARTTGTDGERLLGQGTIKSTLARHGCLHATGPAPLSTSGELKR